MAIGKVKWFNNAKGYGFILPDEGGDDLFAHYSSIQMDGYKTLKAGQEVQFEIIEGPKGLQATDIQAAEGADQESAEGAKEFAEGAEASAAESIDGAPETSQVLSVTVEDAAPSVQMADDLADTQPVEEASKASHSS